MPAFSTDYDLEDRVKNGTAYIASTNKINLAAAGNVRITFENPAGSGKTVYIYSFISATDIAALVFAELRQTPNSGLPSASGNIINQDRGSAATSIAVVKGDSDVLTPLGGGTKLTDLEVPSGRSVFNEQLLVIPQGGLLGIQVPFGVAANSLFRVLYWEE